MKLTTETCVEVLCWRWNNHSHCLCDGVSASVCLGSKYEALSSPSAFSQFKIWFRHTDPQPLQVSGNIINKKKIFQFLVFRSISTNPLHQAAVQTVQGPPFYEQVKLFPMNFDWYNIHCKKYFDYVNMEIANNLKIYGEIESCFDISVPHLRRIFCKQT